MDRGDPLGVSDALLEVVPRPDEIDERGLERELGRFMARHLLAGTAPDVQTTCRFPRSLEPVGESE
ncbi:hypothetical protein AB0G15_32505 [Streptosporangium sp. NPDC023825]|uniref:hypothetical protein n=1 Tax=Streptosporangium sp. NPDC023825 TaxID=3154909 RepID=UPI00342926CF